MDEASFPAYYRDYFQPSRFKGLFGGRGSGKSHAFAGHVVLRMASEPGCRVVCIREVQRSIADSVKQLLEDKIEAFGLGPAFKVTEAEILHANGSRCVFRGMQNHTAATIKSLEGFDLAFVEEAQTISQRSLDLLTPTIRKPGSELWFAWNPDADDDPVDVFLRSNADDPDFLVREVNYDQNPWFPEELRKDAERDKARDPDKYAHVWLGQYRGLSEARVFRNWRVGALEPADNQVWFYGVDWGFANDATAALRCCVMGRVLYIDAEAYGVGIPTDALPALLNKLPQAVDWPMRGDSARPETIDYVRRHGFKRLRAARKGKGSVEDGVTFLQGMDVVINPACPNTINEFKSYAYKTDAKSGAILPVIEDKNNHCIDALRYAVEGLHRKGKLIPVEAPKKKRSRYDEPEEVSNWKTV